MARRRAIEKWVIALVTVTITLIIPGLILERIGLTHAGVVGLAGLAAVIATATLGWRVGAATAVAVTVGVVVADVAAASWLAATALMVLASVIYGLTALRGWQHGLVLAPIAVGFAIAEPPTRAVTGDRPFLLVGLAMVATVAFGVLVAAALSRGATPKPAAPVARLRTRGFAIMLGLAAAITTPITVIAGWGHAGGWLIMTPLIVIQPSLHDAMSKSLRRAAGTIVGFAIAFVIALVIPQGWVLYVIGAVFAGFALYAMGRRWDYSVFAATLTVAVVLLEGASTSVADTGEWRVIATLVGVGIALALVAALTPLYMRVIAREEHDARSEESADPPTR